MLLHQHLRTLSLCAVRNTKPPGCPARDHGLRGLFCTAGSMQVAPNSDGIQKLLAAEQEASRIVAEARKAKSERLRKAKAEAEKEIAAYKAEREGAYQKKLAESSSGAASTTEKLMKETDIKVTQVQADVKAKKAQVVDMLLKYVTTVQLS